MKNIYTQLGVGASYGLFVGGGIGFIVSAIAGNQGAGCYFAVSIVFGMLGIVLPWGEEEDAPEETPTIAALLVEDWVALNDQRTDIAVQRVQLGVAHGHVNRKLCMVEELLLKKYPGESGRVSDGRVVTIGRPGCRLADRMKITQP